MIFFNKLKKNKMAPRSPARTQSGYLLWTKDYKNFITETFGFINKLENENEDYMDFGEIRRQYSGPSKTMIAKTMGEIWKSLPQEAKDVYNEKAARLRN